MANTTEAESATILRAPTAVEFAQMCAIKGALSLEIKGLTRHGRSAYSIAKQKYNLKGSKTKVLAQLEEMIAKTPSGIVPQQNYDINQIKENE